MRLFRNQQTSDQMNLTVTCPQCGRVTAFAFAKEIPDHSKLRCSVCRADVRKEFLHALIQEQILMQKKLRKRLIFLCILSLAAVLILTFMISQADPAPVWYLFFLGISLISFLACVIMLIIGERQVRKFAKLLQDYGLEQP